MTPVENRCGRRRTLIFDLWRNGRRTEAEAVFAQAIIAARGNLTLASHLLDFRSKHNIRLWLEKKVPHLWPLIHGQRALRRAAPRALVRTLAALEAGPMSVLEQILQAAAGMSAEEIAAEVDASVHAGTCDAMQLGQAIADAAAGDAASG